MIIYVYPSDMHGCGYYRLIWPAQELRRRGHDVRIVMPNERNNLSAATDENDRVVKVFYPEDADVLVMQRVTHSYLAQAIPHIRRQGTAVVIDMDDDLETINPKNPAWLVLHPRTGIPGTVNSKHNWKHARDACLSATVVTTSSTKLVDKYARHGRFKILRNCVPESYLKVEHTDSAVFGWGGSLASHPDDLQVMGHAPRELMRAGYEFRIIGDRTKIRETLGLDEDPTSAGIVPIEHWPTALSTLGVGVAPLADTQFNAAKSWLKPLEMAAVGVPFVMSPRQEYSYFQRTLGVGFTAKKPIDWERRLRTLLTSEDARLEASAQGRERAAAWTYEQRADLWLNAWLQAVEIERSVTR